MQVWRVSADIPDMCGSIVYLGEEIKPGLFSNDSEWFKVSTQYAQRVCDALNGRGASANTEAATGQYAPVADIS